MVKEERQKIAEVEKMRERERLIRDWEEMERERRIAKEV